MLEKGSRTGSSVLPWPCADRRPGSSHSRTAIEGRRPQPHEFFRTRTCSPRRRRDAYRLLTADYVSTFEAGGRRFLQVDPEALTLLTKTAMFEIAHLLRPGHLAQLAAILDDPEASPNDVFVATELLEERVHRRGRHPAVVPGHRHRDREGQEGRARAHRRRRPRGHRARHLHAPTPTTTFATRRWRRSPRSRRRTPARTCPAEIEIEAVDGDAYKFLFMAKGGGSANKSLLFQETKALLNPDSLMRWLDEKLRTLGTAACPPYHLALVIGGTSAEQTLKTAKLASARYLDTLPRTGNELGRGFRDVELEQQVLKLTQEFGIGAQFGGKYFCHDVRVIRLPRHGASCPVALAVSCSADRQSLGKITADGVFLEQLETDPARYLPEVTDEHLADDEVVRIDLTQPMAQIRETLSHYPVKTRVMLTGPMVVARDIAHAKLKERLDAGDGPAAVPARLLRLLRRSRQDARGLRVGFVRPDHGGPHGLLRRPVPAQRRLVRDAREGQPLEGGHRRVPGARRLLPRLDRRPGGPARARTASRRSRCSSTPSSAWRRCGRSRWSTSPRSSSSTTRATTSSPKCRSPWRSLTAGQRRSVTPSRARSLRLSDDRVAPAAVAADAAAGRDHPVARDHERQRVVAHRASRRRVRRAGRPARSASSP